MVSKDDGVYVLYPEYFDRRAKRPLRRVPVSLALDNPTAELVAKAALEMRLSPTIEKGTGHPSTWEKQAGRVLVKAVGAKSAILQQVAERMLELRAVERETAAAAAASVPKKK